MSKYVDIIIPVYHATNLLPRMLGSIICQTYHDIINVVIVADGDNEDYSDTINYFKNYISIDFYKLEENKGVGYARNYGMKHSNSEYIMFCDADDALQSASSVSTLLNVLQENKNLHSAYGSIYRVEEPDKNIFGYEVSLFSCVGPHFIWIFGSLHRRSWLEKNNIIFFENSSGEDCGFNELMRLADKTLEGFTFTDDPIYLWTNWNNSNRISQGTFSYIESKKGLVDNYIWCFNKQTEHDEHFYFEIAFVGLTLYYQYLQTWRNLDISNANKMLAYIKEFFDKVYFKYEDNITMEQIAIASSQKENFYQRNNSLYINPKILPFNNFLQKLKEM